MIEDVKELLQEFENVDAERLAAREQRFIQWSERLHEIRDWMNKVNFQVSQGARRRYIRSERSSVGFVFGDLPGGEKDTIWYGASLIFSQDHHGYVSVLRTPFLIGDDERLQRAEIFETYTPEELTKDKAATIFMGFLAWAIKTAHPQIEDYRTTVEDLDLSSIDNSTSDF